MSNLPNFILEVLKGHNFFSKKLLFSWSIFENCFNIERVSLPYLFYTKTIVA